MNKFWFDAMETRRSRTRHVFAHSSVIDCVAVSHAIQGSIELNNNDKFAREEYRKEQEVVEMSGDQSGENQN